MENKDMLTQSQIIEMGWTKSMINKLLPEPILKENPRYRNSAPMKLWDKDVVESIMQTEKFAELLNKSEKRKQKAKDISQKKKDDLLSEINDILENVEIKVIPKETLIEKTLQSKRDWKNKDFQDWEIDSATLDRWCVNYIRHNLVEYYDKTLSLIKGKFGKDNAYATLKKEILKKIALAYPDYAKECQWQIDILQG